LTLAHARPRSLREVFKLSNLFSQRLEHKYQNLAHARMLSEVGNSIRQVVLALAILGVRDRQQDLFIGEVLESCGFFVMSMLAPFFIDQVRKIRALIIADVLGVANAGILIIGVSTQSLEVLWVGSFFMTMISSLYGSVLFAVTTGYAGAEKHMIRLGLTYVQRSILIGALVGLLGVSMSVKFMPLVAFLAIDALSFLVSSYWIFRVTKHDLQNEKSRRGKFESLSSYLQKMGREWKEGFDFVRKSRDLRRAFAINFISCFGYGVLESSVVSTQKLFLGFSDGLITLSRAFNRVASIAGTVLLSRWSREKHKKTSGEILAFSVTLSTLGTAAMLIPSAPFFVASNAVYNFGWTKLNPTLGAMIAANSPHSFLGRVQSFRSLVVNLSILLGNVSVLILGAIIPVQYFFALSSLSFLLTLFVWSRSQKV